MTTQATCMYIRPEDRDDETPLDQNKRCGLPARWIMKLTDGNITLKAACDEHARAVAKKYGAKAHRL